jgi:drug/metabolite transporter (DMT)-like permease
VGGLTIALVLLAALLHAGWNAFTKRSGDPLLAIWLISLGSGLFALTLAPFASFPAREAWPWLAGSVVLHFAYQLFLVAAYRAGDLSQVYPVARGLGPCIVALLAAGLGSEPLAPRQVLGLLLASASVGSLAFAAGSMRHLGGRAVRAALLTGLMIGSYTFVDAQGVRHCERPLDFIVWSMFLDSGPITVAALVQGRGRIRAFLRSDGISALVGGAMAAVAYGIVLWAMAHSPMASIAALRETSVIFAAWIGTRMFGEPFGARRLLAACGVAAGVVLLQL